MLEYKHCEVLETKFHQIKEYLVDRYNLTCYKFSDHKFGDSFVFSFGMINGKSPDDGSIFKYKSNESVGYGHPKVWMYIEKSVVASTIRDDYHRFGMEILLKGKLNETNKGRIKPWEEYNKDFNYQFHHFLNFKLNNGEQFPYIRIDLFNKELEQFQIDKEEFLLNILDKAFGSYISEQKFDTYIQREETLVNLKENFVIEPDETERVSLAKIRTKQGLFKNELIKASETVECKICGITNKKLLVASHIKPWSESGNYERIDPYNGLLLCPTHDAIFDKKLISFDNEGNILISKNLNQLKLLNIVENLRINLHPKSLKYLGVHRKQFEEQEQKD